MPQRLAASAFLLVVLVLPAQVAQVAQGATTVALIGDEHRSVIMREMAGQEGSEIQSDGGVYELAVESAGATLRSLADGEGVTAVADLGCGVDRLARHTCTAVSGWSVWCHTGHAGVAGTRCFQ